MQILISKKEIAGIVTAVARKINRDYRGKRPVIVGVLKGCMIFMADLVRRLKIDADLDFIEVKSYEGVKSTGVVRLLKDITVDITGRDVLLIEDTVDTGATIVALKIMLLKKKPKSLKVAVFLEKKTERRNGFRVEYRGKLIPNVFVVGYGMDCDGKYRNLPEVRILETKQSL